ncbi:transmembrane glycosyltransferase [Solitalea longa]|uniref:Transmembrane glycosyltransferase n=1 Tax=Solitalea longa TaxID=2079460 RepID=A0A2S5A0D1_9SPHI|nr:glycosyltransferase [Solitalea longa]POY36050.1 transmembrane glycosyltransferase [Solitalea longa]
MPIDYTPLSIILLSVLAVSFIVNCTYLFLLYNKFAFNEQQQSEASGSTEPVSIVICARNESENLQKNLAAILEQDYHTFEVIVVNDCSYDNSKEILEGFQAKYQNLKIVHLEEDDKYKHGKKFALTLGIKASKYDLLLLTDADCLPNSNQWISKMMENYSGQTEIVLGYSPYVRQSGFLNKFIRFETFMTALNYFSFAIAGKPYMGVGRNLSYRKDLFFRNKGFAAHMHLPSGDDDLFVNAHANATNTRIEISEEATMLSEPKRTFADFWRQKRRHMSVGKLYKPYHKIMLSIRTITTLIFYGVVIASLIIQVNQHVILGVLLVYLICLTVTYKKAMKKLQVYDLWFFSFLYDFVYNLYLALISLVKPSASKVRWK